MRTMRRAMLGAALLCAVAFQASCATSGSAPEVLTRTEVVEAPKIQYAAIDPTLLAIPVLSPLPAPAVYSAGDCADGCYSNKQMRAIIDILLTDRAVFVDRLRTIRRLNEDAVAATKPP